MDSPAETGPTNEIDQIAEDIKTDVNTVPPAEDSPGTVDPSVEDTSSIEHPEPGSEVGI